MVYRVFFVFLFLFSGLFAFAQNNPLEKRATLQVQKEPLENVLALITKQTDVRFSYNSQLIDPKKQISIHAQNKTIKEILSKILPSSVAYKKVGEHIVFYAVANVQPVRFENPDRINKMNTAENQSDTIIFEKNEISHNGKPADSCHNSKSATEDTLHLIKDTVNLTKEEEMKAEIAGIMMAIATASTPLAAQDTVIEITDIAEVTEITVVADSVTPQKTKPAQLTFIYPVGTGGVNSAENSYNLSINVLGGVTGQTKGLELGSLFNINKYGASGGQFAGIFNLTLANNPDIQSNNAQFAGIFNVTQKGKSAQFAGVFNRGDIAYIQAAGIFNSTNESYCQLAGIANQANTVDFQASGIANIANTTDCQIAGIANIAQESKCQIAGVVNITKKGRFQLGVINIRDTADGVSLGLINIVKKGGIMEFGIEAGEFVHTAATFRSGTQRLYSILSIGCNYTEGHYWASNNGFFTTGYGLGTSFNLIGNLGLNLELTYNSCYKMWEWGRTYSEYSGFTKFSPMLNYRFAKHFKIYAGPSLNIRVRRDNGILNDFYYTHPSIDIPYSMYSRLYSHSRLDMWIGVVGGIKF